MQPRTILICHLCISRPGYQSLCICQGFFCSVPNLAQKNQESGVHPGLIYIKQPSQTSTDDTYHVRNRATTRIRRDSPRWRWFWFFPPLESKTPVVPSFKTSLYFLRYFLSSSSGEHFIMRHTFYALSRVFVIIMAAEL